MPLERGAWVGPCLSLADCVSNAQQKGLAKNDDAPKATDFPMKVRLFMNTSSRRLKFRIAAS
jgi:hypothetical protein